MNTQRFFLLTRVFVVMAMGACPTLAGSVSAPSIASLIENYAADQHDVAAAFPVPGSSNRFARLETLYTGWLSRLITIPFDTLPQSAKVDYVLLRNDLENSLSELARERVQWGEINAFVAYRTNIYILEEARLKGEPTDSQAAATRVSRLSGQIKELRARVEQGLKTNATAAASNTLAAAHSPTGTPLVISAPLAQRAAAATDSLRATLKTWYSFHEGFQPDFTWWVNKPYEEADKALGDYAKFLREEVAGIKGKDDDPIVGKPLGEAGISDAIQHEFISYSAAELLAIGEGEMAWCEREMKAAARDMGFGDDWKAALAKVKADFVPPGEQAALISGLAREAIAFTKAHHLVTIPPMCEETWTLSMMSPETLKTIPYAAYNGQAMMVAYARDSMPHDDKLMTMRGNNRHFTRNVTPHELIPGHHLQRYQAARNNHQRSYFNTPFYVEGWALYWERRLWDLGWAKSPEDRLGMLFWRMTRAARVEVALQFHLGKMTPPEIVEFLVNRVGHERSGATAEARRLVDGGFPPLYQAAYLLGALQLEALRTDLVGKGLMTESGFNDAILAANAIPIELIRSELLNLPLSRDFHPSWRFAPLLSPVAKKP